MWRKIKHLATCLKNIENFLIAKIYRMDSLGVFLYAHLHVKFRSFEMLKNMSLSNLTILYWEL